MVFESKRKNIVPILRPVNNKFIKSIKRIKDATPIIPKIIAPRILNVFNINQLACWI